LLVAGNAAAVRLLLFPPGGGIEGHGVYAKMCLVFEEMGASAQVAGLDVRVSRGPRGAMQGWVHLGVEFAKIFVAVVSLVGAVARLLREDLQGLR